MLSSIPFLGGSLFQFCLIIILTITAGVYLGILLSEMKGGYYVR